MIWKVPMSYCLTRHLIKQFLNKLKQYRSIASRYDKTAPNFLDAIHLAVAVIWLN